MHRRPRHAVACTAATGTVGANLLRSGTAFAGAGRRAAQRAATAVRTQHRSQDPRSVDRPGRVDEQEISGQDEWTPKVNDALRTARCPTLPVATSADVELKLAARMREQGATDPTMRHVSVVLNRRPCE
ncbi:DddA-like double-stranded DNA deaminase toxin [Actinosynnema sp. NPDC050436]|uniref:DddA-like double-stranded DNA deaminase toxin n=1 Tax=Actinosynnema sp. NPDC050436 TaxID=3155659 RepID=UPI0033E1FFCC